MGCASVEIPNIRFYREIPFTDGAEAVYIESLTKKRGTLTASEWAEIRPYMVSIDPAGVKAIKKQWSEACRPVGDKCNVVLTSVSGVLEKLDLLTAKFMKVK